MTYLSKLVSGDGREIRNKSELRYDEAAGDSPRGQSHPKEKARIGIIEPRLLIVAGAFALAFGYAGCKLAQQALFGIDLPKSAYAAQIGLSRRAEIVDRNGDLLATNMKVQSLYIQPNLTKVLYPRQSSEKLARIFPEIDAERVVDSVKKGKFDWLKRILVEEQVDLVNEIGDPGLLLGTREARVYPSGELAAHVLGGTAFGEEHTFAAEIIGTAGVEKYFDRRLREQVNVPLELSLDLRAQWIVQQELKSGVGLFGAKSGGAVLMDVHSGEIISLDSQPGFDPNHRSSYSLLQKSGKSPLFSHSTQRVSELGSVFKVFTLAQALELGEVNPDTIVDNRPYKVSIKVIKDKYQNSNGDMITVRRATVKSANPVTARLAKMIGPERQKEFLGKLGLLDPVQVELPEARISKPLYPRGRWSDLSSATIAYGHGISVTILNLAKAYAILANGGYSIEPTILKKAAGNELGERIVSKATSDAVLSILRDVVREGTATEANVSGYSVGGKTGTGNKPVKGYYAKNKVISTFASVFPTERPRYVLIVVLDEPEIKLQYEARRTAGWTAAPVAAAMIKRLAPVLGIAPRFESSASGA